MTKERVLRFFDKYIASNGPSRHKLSVQVVSKQHEEAIAAEEEEGAAKSDGGVSPSLDSRTVLITDAIEFKRSMPLFAMPSKVDIDVTDLGIQK